MQADLLQALSTLLSVQHLLFLLGGTLLGALFIAVIENAMNLTGIESFTQKVVLGLVILAAVGLDMARRRKL